MEKEPTGLHYSLGRIQNTGKGVHHLGLGMTESKKPNVKCLHLKEVWKKPVQCWYGSSRCIVDPGSFSFCSSVLADGFHSQGHFTDENGCWSFFHHVYILGNNMKEGREGKTVPLSQPPLRNTRFLLQHFLISHRPEFKHMAKTSHKEGWEIGSFGRTHCALNTFGICH